MDESEISLQSFLEATGEARELVDEYSDLFKIIPYAKTAIVAYRWARRRRFVMFFKALSKVEGELPPQDAKKLKTILTSEQGAEILADYVDTAVRTSSLLAGTALGILYGDVNDKDFSRSFKTQACRALDRADDALLAAFLGIHRSLSHFKCQPDGPYPVYFLGPEVTHFLSSEAKESPSDSQAIASLRELINRGLLAPDHVRTRIEGKTWSMGFGIGPNTSPYATLLGRAKDFVQTEQKQVRPNNGAQPTAAGRLVRRRPW